MGAVSNGAVPAPAAKQAAAGGGAAARPGVSGTRLALSTQKIIYTAHVAFQVKDAEAAASAAAADVTVAGGYVAREQEVLPPGQHRVPSVQLALEIPSRGT
jgi:hypothetical protein